MGPAPSLQTPASSSAALQEEGSCWTTPVSFCGGRGPGPQDNVDGWCFNAAECYFYWTGKTINFYFIANDCGLCITARCPWIIASRSRCYFAETNSSDKICRRLIVYSCFMARCNLNTFMISLKARWRQRRCRFLLTSGFISSVRFIISRLRSVRHYVRHATVSRSSSFILPSRFHLSRFDWLNYSDLCKWLVFIFLPWKWKLKVTQRDPHLLLKLNCSECAVWLARNPLGFVNRRLWPCSHAASAPVAMNWCVMTRVLRFYGATFKYSQQNKSNHVQTGLPGQGPAPVGPRVLTNRLSQYVWISLYSSHTNTEPTCSRLHFHMLLVTKIV